jgi:hypothetical protein
MMHEMHHSVLLAQWSAEVRHTLTLMIQCFGRSAHTYKMPNKPITQGYKLFALADHRYIYSFMWSSRKQGLGELVKHPKLTPTGNMVLRLI